MLSNTVLLVGCAQRDRSNDGASFSVGLGADVDSASAKSSESVRHVELGGMCVVYEGKRFVGRTDELAMVLYLAAL